MYMHTVATVLACACTVAVTRPSTHLAGSRASVTTSPTLPQRPAPCSPAVVDLRATHAWTGTLPHSCRAHPPHAGSPQRRAQRLQLTLAHARTRRRRIVPGTRPPFPNRHRDLVVAEPRRHVCSSRHAARVPPPHSIRVRGPEHPTVARRGTSAACQQSQSARGGCATWIGTADEPRIVCKGGRARYRRGRQQEHRV